MAFVRVWHGCYGVGADLAHCDILSVLIRYLEPYCLDESCVEEC